MAYCKSILDWPLYAVEGGSGQNFRPQVELSSCAYMLNPFPHRDAF